MLTRYREEWGRMGDGLQQGKYKEGIADLETAHRINPISLTIQATRAYAYGLSGNRAAAEAQLQSLIAESRATYVSPWVIGFVYLGIGDKRQSLTWFEKAVREHSADMPAAKVSPECDPLRQDPRFQELRALMKLTG